MGLFYLQGEAMKVKYLLLSILALALSTSISASELIEGFAKHSAYHQVVLSPDGKHYAVTVTNKDGKRTILILDRATNKQVGSLSWRGREIPNSVVWLNNERVAIEVGIKVNALDQPLLTGEYVAMNIDGSRKMVLHGLRKETKRNKRRSKAAMGQMFITDLLPEEPDYVNILTIPNGESFAELKRINVYTGREKRLAKSPLKGGGMLADHNGNARFAVGIESVEGINKTVVYYKKTKDSDWELFDRYDEDLGSISPLAFDANNEKVYVLSNYNRETKAIYALDLQTKKLELVSQNERVDVQTMDFGPKRQLYAVHYEPDYSSIDVLDPNHPLGKWYPAFIKSFNGAKVSIVSSTYDMTEMVVQVESDKDPGSYYVFNSKTGNLSLLMKSKPWLDTKKMGSTEAFSFKARDGKTIYGFITLPKGKETNLPLIVIPHGGPHGPRDYWTFDDDVQLLASHGYAVLRVNFRGSGGYGKEYQSSGYRKWGSAIMDDITDGVNWAIAQNIADKDRLCIYGASFGGYSALMGPVREPDLYKCAIGYVGVYDMDLLFKTGDVPESQYGTNFLKKVIGEDRAQIEAFSPARHVDKIKSAVFIVHGEKDQRAHFDHALLLRDKFEQANKPYQWLTKPKEGHGFYNEDNRLDLYNQMLAFFEKHIGK